MCPLGWGVGGGPWPLALKPDPLGGGAVVKGDGKQRKVLPCSSLPPVHTACVSHVLSYITHRPPSWEPRSGKPLKTSLAGRCMFVTVTCQSREETQFLDRLTVAGRGDGWTRVQDCLDGGLRVRGRRPRVSDPRTAETRGGAFAESDEAEFNLSRKFKHSSEKETLGFKGWKKAVK